MSHVETRSHTEVLRLAEQWYHRQLEVLARCHGSSWPEHREWVDAYLRQEIRQRLIAIGWRPKT
jgi:hypothetical protein